ncbi:uncharacterized protein LOC124160347 isoform X2 [Ischnura elegans]|uniref:uncharacterized protein LOC124160347 isoform X2 n=1 Tax=Ischnura elegans TaxID=197161 RepID=UPI001ED8B46C|nr:uncharacterized protein LOC124160347 isoform X2 [Ischnura elegans]
MEDWQPGCNGSVPPAAFVGGKDVDSILYIARARHNGGWMLGKLNPRHRRCYIAYEGEEIGKSNYEVLCGSNLNFVWMKSSEGLVPISVPVTDEEDTFIGRVHHKGTITVGKAGRPPQWRVLHFI